MSRDPRRLLSRDDLTYAERTALARSKGERVEPRVPGEQARGEQTREEPQADLARPAKPLGRITLPEHKWWRTEEPDVDLETEEERDERQLQRLTWLWLAWNGCLRQEPPPKPGLTLVSQVQAMPRAHLGTTVAIGQIREALRQTHGHRKQAAQILGISPRMMSYYVRRFKIDKDFTELELARVGARQMKQRERSA